mgnify:FL=1
MRSIFSKRTNHWANWDRLGPTLIIKTHIVSIVLFLLPIHLLFIKIKNYLYDKNIVSPTKVDATVISVGNISLGGAGKTPFTIALSNFLAQRGKSVGVLTRGYGRKSGGDFLLKNHSVEEAGDETIVLKNNLSKSIPIYVSKNKILGANALASLGCEIIILDDAFQHRKIYRDIDVVLVNPDELQEKNKKTFPWGLLREPFYNIDRADIIITNKTNLYKESSPLKNSLSINTEFENEALSSSGRITINQLSGLKNVMSICGIGKPESFQKSLSGLNIGVVENLIYPDHHSFSKKDVSNIKLNIEKYKIDAIVCTEKDWVKLVDFKEEIGIPIYAVRINHHLKKDIQDAVLCLL